MTRTEYDEKGPPRETLSAALSVFIADTYVFAESLVISSHAGGLKSLFSRRIKPG